MMNIRQLTEEYKRDGVIRARGLLAADELAQVNTALDRYLREVVPGLPEADRVYEADGQSIRNLWHMEQYDEYFRELAVRPKILDLVRALVKGEPVLMAVETFNKPARTGSGVPWHQDNTYFCYAPPDALTVWIALDAATVENGAVYYAPGSQHELRPHEPSGVAGNSMKLAADPQIPLAAQFCGTLEPGDALLHHCQVLHRSDPNTTEYSRRGLLMVFRGAHTAPDAALKAQYQKAGAA